MNADTYDWPTIIEKSREDLGMFPSASPQYDSVLRKKNFMTTEVLGTFRMNGIVVEVATGWFMTHRIYGVTIDRPFDTSPDERDRCFDNWDEEVVPYLKQLAGFPS